MSSGGEKVGGSVVWWGRIEARSECEVCLEKRVGSHGHVICSGEIRGERDKP